MLLVDTSCLHPLSSIGTKVSVYGTLDSTSAGVTTTYAIDGGSAASVVSPAGSGDTYKQLSVPPT